MNALRRTSALALILLVLSSQSSAQQQRRAGEATSSIAGQVTIGDNPAAGIVVALAPSESYSLRQTHIARTRTDEQGYYRLTGLPAGRYTVVPLAHAYVAPTEAGQRWPGKPITLQEGGAVESLDIQLTRGGVITGRVTDADGRPLIGVRVRLAHPGRNNTSFIAPYSGMYETDDRGIYRLYGLPEGPYTVSVGEVTNQPGARGGFGGNYYPRTYHPDTTNESMASIIEVRPGSEATGIDIKVGRPAKSFAVTGRVVDGRTGKPVVGAICGYSPVSADGKQLQSWSMGFRTDAAGNFRIEGMLSGRYVAFATSASDNDSYSEPVPFEVNGEDVHGLEIKLVPGSSISGVAVLEGTDDPSVLSRISELRLLLSRPQGDEFRPPMTSAQIAPDGSFRIGGLNQGMATLQLSYSPGQQNFVLTRVERDGIEQNGPIEIAPGQHITGMRVVICYGSSVVRGQIVVEDGSLPEGVQLSVDMRKQGSQWGPRRFLAADQRGRFIIDGLVAGDYEISVSAWRPVQQGGISLWERVKQSVTVGKQTETEVTINFKLKEIGRDN
ncbi:MAG TPA: carboxypeptidase regulatory-like domain-containing protein [Blastocatellia bacterium]|nr:carboxypeptidase regulatory-like domain-containing protein [Blastocatellia bacterium]